jgi:hypothetical protein
MRALLSAVMAAALITSVSACHFKYGNQWVDCDDKGNNCAASTPTPAPTVKPTVAPTVAPTPAPTAAPSCAPGLTLTITNGISACVATQSNGGGA